MPERGHHSHTDTVGTLQRDVAAGSYQRHTHSDDYAISTTAEGYGAQRPNQLVQTQNALVITDIYILKTYELCLTLHNYYCITYY